MITAPSSPAEPRLCAQREAGTESQARLKTIYDEVGAVTPTGETLLGVARDSDAEIHHVLKSDGPERSGLLPGPSSS